MKRNLLLLAAFMLAVVTADAQLQRMRQQNRAPQKAMIEPGNNQAWWGFVGANDETSGLGVQAAETYDCAIFIPGDNSVAAGKTIKAIRFALYSSNVSGVKVWLSESLPNNSLSNTKRMVNVASLEQGVNDVALSGGYQMTEKGVYVGYSFTITNVANGDDAYPISITGEPAKNLLWLRTSSSVTSWVDLNSYGRLYLQVLLEGEFAQNAAQPANFGECVVCSGQTGSVNVVVTNQGMNAIQSVDYTITTDGVASAEQHYDLPWPVAFSTTFNMPVVLAADELIGTKRKTLTITKVNGQVNEETANSCQGLVCTVTRMVTRNVAVEEYTGTACGWCPRGLVGMEKLRNTFGSQFVGIGIHGYNGSSMTDAMYIKEYNHVDFSGAPSARLNRGEEIDPYYGSSNDVCDDFRAELAIPAKVGVEVEGQWNENFTAIDATATIESVADGGDYLIEYVLIADSLKGTTAAWKQANYYSSSYASSTGMSLSSLPEDLKFLWTAGSGYFPVFNDVAIAIAKSSETTAPGQMGAGDKVTNTHTLKMPTYKTLKNAIKNDNVAVVALVINKETGKIANAAKYYMNTQTNGINTTPTTASTRETGRYTLGGQPVDGYHRGVNIVRMADGSVRKVVVK